MKRIFLFSLVLTMFGFVSCQEEDVYSCNEEINEFVTMNLDEFKMLNRSEWCDLELILQRPAYRTFSMEKRQEFWKQKIEEVMELDWNDKERAHLQSLLTFIQDNQQVFKSYLWEDEEEFDKYDRFTYEWISYAETELGWERRLIKNIIADGNRIKDKKGTLDISTEKMRQYLRRAEFLPDCDCNQAQDWCDTHCGNDPCDEKIIGCGNLWATNCDGLCE